MKNSNAGFLSSRYLVTSFDFIAWLTAVFFALVLWLEFDLSTFPFMAASGLALGLSLVFLTAAVTTRLYANRHVHGSFDELKSLVFSTMVTCLGVGSPMFFFGPLWALPRSAVFLAWPFFLLLAGGFRAFLRLARARSRPLRSGKRAIIYGAGVAAEGLIPQLLSDPASPYQPVVLVDDSPMMSNRRIHGVPMGGKWSDVAGLVGTFGAEAVIVAIPSATSELLSRVYSDAKELGLTVVVLPSLREYLSSRSSPAELRDVTIDDLIGRQTHRLRGDEASTVFRGKRVLVTGAGGSIGSELARQIAPLHPSHLALVDHDETALVIASPVVDAQAHDVQCETYLLDVRDRDAVHRVLNEYRPDIVFHAAALKQLPILERFPAEAWKTNVEGTLHVLESSREAGVSVFVNISTDKAANPVSVLGRSKRLTEQLTAWFGSQTGLRYVSVRFGNVLGSRGSLIPLLADQISRGGPVTLTDQRATRYFMSNSEACQLVIEAATQAEEGDVLVLDMGEPVRIQDIAEKMIELSGQSVAIEYIGLRPGEKLHEDLLADSEEQLPSPHPAMKRFKASPKNPEEVAAEKW